MDLQYFQKQHRTTTTIDKSDWIYMKKHGIKVAHAVRAFVRDHRVHTNDPDAEPSVREIRDQRDRVIAHRDKVFTALRKKLGDEEFGEFLANI